MNDYQWLGFATLAVFIGGIAVGWALRDWREAGTWQRATFTLKPSVRDSDTPWGV